VSSAAAAFASAARDSRESEEAEAGAGAEDKEGSGARTTATECGAMAARGPCCNCSSSSPPFVSLFSSFMGKFAAFDAPAWRGGAALLLRESMPIEEKSAEATDENNVGDALSSAASVFSVSSAPASTLRAASAASTASATSSANALKDVPETLPATPHPGRRFLRSAGK